MSAPGAAERHTGTWISIADPFRPSGELLLLLHERARQLERARQAPAARRLRALVSRSAS